MFFEQIQREYATLLKEIESVRTQLDSLPDGKLICARNGTRYKWYHSIGSSKSYLPKSKHHLAEQLAQKEYLSLHLQDMLQEKKALEQYFLHHLSAPSRAIEYQNSSPEHQKLLHTIYSSPSKDLVNWQNAPYERNQNYPEKLVHKTISGNLVRSKSEALIDMSLFNNNIPFRYECALKLGENILYPDFTILHPRTHKIYYWEHFGIMDDPSYAHRAINKLQTYIANGLIPNIHLITTYETKDTPLSSDMVNKIVNYYFR